MRTIEAMRAVVPFVVTELSGFVDRNTRPLSRAAAAFTKRQAADLKAGFADGAASVLRELEKNRVLEAAEWAFRNGYVPPGGV